MLTENEYFNVQDDIDLFEFRKDLCKSKSNVGMYYIVTYINFYLSTHIKSKVVSTLNIYTTYYTATQKIRRLFKWVRIKIAIGICN